jgi:hypothetical protein
MLSKKKHEIADTVWVNDPPPDNTRPANCKKSDTTWASNDSMRHAPGWKVVGIHTSNYSLALHSWKHHEVGFFP